MSVIPQEIPDLGSSQLAPRQNPEFAPGPGFTTEDYFVWSRLDGRTSFREVILMVGLGIEKSIGILRRLRRSGALLLPGEDPGAMKANLQSRIGSASPPSPAEAPSTPPSTPPSTQPVPPPAVRQRAAAPAVVQAKPETDAEDRELPALGSLSAEEQGILAEEVALQEFEKRRIIQMMRLVAGSDYFALLGVPRTADKRELKRAYFRLSKEFHPDRHYKQDLGTFGPLLNIIFENATQAFQELSDDDRRAAHVAQLADPGGSSRATGGRVVGLAADAGSGPVVAGPGGPRRQQAIDLFTRGCELEVTGDAAGALHLFRTAIQIDAQPRYLRRATKCALAFGHLEEAHAYADKAIRLRAGDASYARLMSDVLRAAGRLDEAEDVLVRALEMPSAGDALARELQGDLAAVRSARAAAMRAKG